jgi:hypothetical protein
MTTYLDPSRLIASGDSPLRLLMTAPGSALKVIGCDAVPLCGKSQPSWNPAYAPARTTTVSPASTRLAVLWIVLKGAPSVPAAASFLSGET